MKSKRVFIPMILGAMLFHAVGCRTTEQSTASRNATSVDSRIKIDPEKMRSLSLAAVGEDDCEGLSPQEVDDIQNLLAKQESTAAACQTPDEENSVVQSLMNANGGRGGVIRRCFKWFCRKLGIDVDPPKIDPPNKGPKEPGEPPGKPKDDDRGKPVKVCTTPRECSRSKGNRPRCPGPEDVIFPDPGTYRRCSEAVATLAGCEAQINVQILRGCTHYGARGGGLLPISQYLGDLQKELANCRGCLDLFKPRAPGGTMD